MIGTNHITGMLHGAREIGLTGHDAARMLDRLFDEAVAAPRTSHLTGELFLLNENAAATASRIVDATQRGARTSILFDPGMEPAAQHRGQLAAAGARLVAYGRPESTMVRSAMHDMHVRPPREARSESTTKLHSKVWTLQTRDGYRGVLTTASLKNFANTDISISLREQEAELLHRITLAAMSGDARLERELMGHARGLGLLYNDPILGTHALTDAKLSAISTAVSDVHVGAKTITDPAVDRAIVAATRNGANVRVAARDVPERSRAAYASAGAAFTDLTDVASFRHPLHGNIERADGHVVASSAHGTPRALALDPAYASRELGFRSDDPNLVRAADRALAQMQLRA